MWCQLQKNCKVGAMMCLSHGRILMMLVWAGILYFVIRNDAKSGEFIDGHDLVRSYWLATIGVQVIMIGNLPDVIFLCPITEAMCLRPKRIAGKPNQISDPIFITLVRSLLGIFYLNFFQWFSWLRHTL